MLQEKLRELAELNRKHEEVKSVVDKLEKVIHALPEYEAFNLASSDAKKVSDEIASIRSEINTLTIEAYERTGEKKPAPGVGIRVSMSYDYDDDLAFAYCRSELPQALKLDKRTFEKFIKGVQEVRPLDFVTVEEKVTPTIASDLSEYLA